jgi:hypothetical protein
MASERIGKNLNYSWRDVWYGISTLITGLGLGWFVGLAFETLTTTLLTTILTLVTASMTVAAGIGVATEDADGATRANPIMVMLLVVGLVAGSRGSGWLRSNLALGPDAKIVAGKTGMTECEINRRVFDQLYHKAEAPKDSEPDAKNPAKVIPKDGRLPAGDLKCEWLCLTDEELLAEVKKLNNPAYGQQSANRLRDQIRNKPCADCTGH